MKRLIFYIIILWYSFGANTTFAFTHADTLRGSNGRGRDWWDVRSYSLNVNFDLAHKSINGSNAMSICITKTPNDSMQIDLQEPMLLDSVAWDGKFLPFVKEGNVWWVKGDFQKMKTGSNYALLIYYHGVPKTAVNPPWDGGFSWKTDSAGKPWVAVSCQGLGASVWWPCKDAQWDEPDLGMITIFKIPQNLTIVSNGTLIGERTIGNKDSSKFVIWDVKNPINNYDVTFYLGDYVHWHDTLSGEKGTLDLDFWVLRQNEEKARKHFAVVKPMLHCYEYWMGPYPFYEDGYKLVDAPYLGMEHQSAVAYGNGYKMGYRGFDRTFTGIGMKFDYIIIHESGHEWFGNSITARDIADNWIHEGITTYCESLFAECQQGKEKGQKYCRGEWLNIESTKPVIAHYGVNEEGTNDMYDKGAAMMYMIRQMTGDDEKFRLMLRGLSKEFYHGIVTTAQVEDYISKHTGLDLKAFFDQYLRRSNIPQLEYYVNEGKLFFQFNKAVDGFTLPLVVTCNNVNTTIHPTANWQSIPWEAGCDVKFSNDFLVGYLR